MPIKFDDKLYTQSMRWLKTQPQNASDRES